MSTVDTKLLEEEIRSELLNLKEEKLKDFSSSLIPGCDNIMGVRTPNVRKLAKQILKKYPLESVLSFVNNSDEIYFEETLIKGFIIGNLKEDLHTVLKQVELFIPKITNWAVCDSFCSELKITKKHQDEVLSFLDKYLNSDKPYEIRFGVVMLLVYFVEEKYLQYLFSTFNNIKNDDYYVKMAVAWAISKCFVKFPNQTMVFLKDNNIDNETYNKSLQKIRESLKVDKDTKEIIKSMKRK